MQNNFVPAVEDIGEVARARAMFYLGNRAVHAPLSAVETAFHLHASSRPIEYFGNPGKVGTGNATADSAAMDAALEWLAEAASKNLGGKIAFGPKTYRLSGGHRFSAPGTLEGAGGAFMNQFSSTTQIFNGTVLKLESGVNVDMFQCWLDTSLFSLVQDYRGFMRFDGLLLNGNRSANGNHPNTDLNSTGNGIVAKGTRYVIVDNCVVMMFAQDGILTEGYDYGSGSIGPNNYRITNSAIHNNGGRGFDGISAADGHFSNNSVGYNGGDGVRSAGNGVVANNLIWNNAGHGLDLTTVADMVVGLNKVYDNRKSGIVLRSALPGVLLVGNASLRNNAVENTDPLDSAGFWIGDVGTGVTMVGNQAHNLFSSNDKFQLYGYYFSDADSVVSFDGNHALGNLTENIRLAAATNIQWHADTSTSRGTHPGFRATGSIDANANQVMNVAALTGSAWTAKSVSSNDLNVGGSRHCSVTPGGAVTVNTITTNVTGLMEVYVRNGSSSNSITITHNNAAIRCPNGANATIGPLEMAHFIHVSGAVWQMLGT